MSGFDAAPVADAPCPTGTSGTSSDNRSRRHRTDPDMRRLADQDRSSRTGAAETDDAVSCVVGPHEQRRPPSRPSAGASPTRFEPTVDHKGPVDRLGDVEHFGWGGPRGYHRAMSSIWSRWGDVLAATAAAVPLVVLLIGFLAHRRRRHGTEAGAARRDSAAEVAVVAGTLPWLWMTLTPSDGAGGVRPVPLIDLVELFGGPPGELVIQLVGNLLVFAVAGFCVPIRWSVGVPTVAAMALIGSVFIETTQYVADLGRVSSIDDVLLNTGGAVLAATASRRWWRRGSVAPIAPA